ncbi:MAG TPA: hypothetical protein VHK28_01735 [Candidatus Limnocylindria bacterium]|nr:hypothetical protein [Candidatus Limnocylindria bacterium]
MLEQIVSVAVVAILCATAFLYAALISRRVRERRVRNRIYETIHLTAVVRTTIAQRRSLA